MIILALDLGKFNSLACKLHTKSNRSSFQAVRTDRFSIASLLKKVQPDLVVMEACGPSGWISDLCHDLDLETLVCSTNDEAWQWKNVKRKTDKDDALKLARMAMLGMLTAVHIPTPDVRERRTLIKYRKTLDQRINRVKNSIRSLFANRGIQSTLENEPGAGAETGSIPSASRSTSAKTANSGRENSTSN